MPIAIPILCLASNLKTMLLSSSSQLFLKPFSNLLIYAASKPLVVLLEGAASP